VNNKLKSEISYVYELKQKYVDVNEQCFIKGNINVDNMNDLIFYIQYKYHNVISQSILTQFELKEILIKCYGIESISDVEADEIIDLHRSFEENFNKGKIDNIMNNSKIYEARGLAGKLNEIVYSTIEKWR